MPKVVKALDVIKKSDDEEKIVFDKATAAFNSKIGCKTCYGRGYVESNASNLASPGFVRDNAGNLVVFIDYCDCVKRKLYKKRKEGEFAFMSYRVNDKGDNVEALSCG